MKFASSSDLVMPRPMRVGGEVSVLMVRVLVSLPESRRSASLWRRNETFHPTELLADDTSA